MAPREDVGDWMTQEPQTTTPDTTVEDALERMLSGGFRHLPVVDDGRLVGMVSIRDLAGAED
jgi:CBS domain-containing protein